MVKSGHKDIKVVSNNTQIHCGIQTTGINIPHTATPSQHHNTTICQRRLKAMDSTSGSTIWCLWTNSDLSQKVCPLSSSGESISISLSVMVFCYCSLSTSRLDVLLTLKLFSTAWWLFKYLQLVWSFSSDLSHQQTVSSLVFNGCFLFLHHS